MSLRRFESVNEASAYTDQLDRYSQHEVMLDQYDIDALRSGYVLVHDYDDKSCIIHLKQE